MTIHMNRPLGLPPKSGAVKFSKTLFIIHSFTHPLFSWGGFWGYSYRRTRNISRSTAILDSHVSATPRRDHLRSKMQLCQIAIIWPLGRFPVNRFKARQASTTCPETFWLHGRTNQCSWDFSVRRRNYSIFRNLRISQGNN